MYISTSCAARRLWALAAHIPPRHGSGLHTTSTTSNSEAGELRKVGTGEALAKSVVCGVVSIPMLSLACLAAPLSKSWALWLVSCWTRFNLKLFGITIEVEVRHPGSDHNTMDNRTNKPGKVIVSLHQGSLLDSWITHELLLRQHKTLPKHGPFFVFANIEYLLIPLFGWLVWLRGAVMVIRQWHYQGDSVSLTQGQSAYDDAFPARAALDRAAIRVKNGENCFISIEGRRSTDGSLSPYKRGVAVLAISAQAPIHPFMLVGCYDLWPMGSWKINSGKVKVIVLEPISTEGLTLEDRFTLTQRLRTLAETILEERKKERSTE